MAISLPLLVHSLLLTGSSEGHGILAVEHLRDNRIVTTYNIIVVSPLVYFYFYF